MREAIGGTWIFGIVVTFIVLFSSYLAISVNYSKAFKVKNDMVSVIEEYEGYNDNSQQKIERILSGNGYAVRGPCKSHEQGIDGSAGKYKYCIHCVEKNDSLKKSYYTVKVFFRLDLPVIGDIFTFPVTGSTKTIHFPTNQGTGLKCESA
ncbi:MAG: hypothetical protein PHF21_02225 [Bacilli bacterium]|nr:hypothetical protein [Bacilli bacterium]